MNSYKIYISGRSIHKWPVISSRLTTNLTGNQSTLAPKKRCAAGCADQSGDLPELREDCTNHAASRCRLKAAIFAANFGHFGSEAMLSKLAPRSCGASDSTPIFLLYTLPVLPCCNAVGPAGRVHCLGNCALTRLSAFGLPPAIKGP